MEITTIEANQNLFEVLDVPNPTFEKMRLDLMVAVAKWFKAAEVSQTQAAELLECSQPQLNDILKFKYEKFSIERLLKIVEKTGQRAELSILNDVCESIPAPVIVAPILKKKSPCRYQEI